MADLVLRELAKAKYENENKIAKTLSIDINYTNEIVGMLKSEGMVAWFSGYYTTDLGKAKLRRGGYLWAYKINLFITSISILTLVFAIATLLVSIFK